MSSSKNLEFKQQSFLNKSNSQFIEEMYVRFIENDPKLPDSWKKYFSDLNEDLNSVSREISGPSWSPKKISIDPKKNKRLDELTMNELKKIESRLKENVLYVFDLKNYSALQIYIMRFVTSFK